MFVLNSYFIIVFVYFLSINREGHSQKLRCIRSNEVADCVYSCPPEKTCENRLIQCLCLRKDDEVCTEKCVCKEGFTRNLIGECIKDSDCERCTGKNEYFSCGTACDNECESLHVQNKTNCPIVNIVCNKKCYCQDGFARDKNNDCISIDKCEEHRCGINEVYLDCLIPCPPDSCTSLVARYACPKPICTQGCKCKDGYLRQDKKDGVCIPWHRCPQLQGSPDFQ